MSCDVINKGDFSMSGLPCLFYCFRWPVSGFFGDIGSGDFSHVFQTFHRSVNFVNLTAQLPSPARGEKFWQMKQGIFFIKQP